MEMRLPASLPASLRYLRAARETFLAVISATKMATTTAAVATTTVDRHAAAFFTSPE